MGFDTSVALIRTAWAVRRSRTRVISGELSPPPHFTNGPNPGRDAEDF
jgi:hypothetical protein